MVFIYHNKWWQHCCFWVSFFSENGSAAHMTHHCTVYYRDVLVTVPGGVTFISLLVLLSTMSSIGGRSGWKGTVCPRLIPLSHSLLHSTEHFFRPKHMDIFFVQLDTCINVYIIKYYKRERYRIIKLTFKAHLIYGIYNHICNE